MGQQRSLEMQDQVHKMAQYKREAARLRAEEQKDERDQKMLEKEQKKYAIFEKHVNMQNKLDCK